MVLKVKLDEGAYMPTKAYTWDAGFDLYSPIFFKIGEAINTIVVNTGVHVEIPEGYYGRITSKSGLATKYGIDVIEGVIDAGYAGPIKVTLRSNSRVGKYLINTGEKICQLIIEKIPDITLVKVDEIESGERGQNGFGSSGR